jgi:cytochrome c-type biogenesis protein CcmH
MERLRTNLATLDPKTDKARQGYVLLGNAEAQMGDLAKATADWRTALDAQFDPTLAVQIAEAQSRLDGHVGPESADLFRRALAAGPADAPWRAMAQQRLEEKP